MEPIDATMWFRFPGSGLAPVAGWCRCGDHADLIEDFLSDYALRYDDEGWVIDLLEEDEDEDDG